MGSKIMKKICVCRQCGRTVYKNGMFSRSITKLVWFKSHSHYIVAFLVLMNKKAYLLR